MSSQVALRVPTGLRPVQSLVWPQGLGVQRWPCLPGAVPGEGSTDKGSQRALGRHQGAAGDCGPARPAREVISCLVVSKIQTYVIFSLVIIFFYSEW